MSNPAEGSDPCNRRVSPWRLHGSNREVSDAPPGAGSFSVVVTTSKRFVSIASSPKKMFRLRGASRRRRAPGQAIYGTMCVRNHACCFFSISSSRAMASLSMPMLGALLLARSPTRGNCRSSDPSRILSA